jgi:hypothetical protein
MLDKLKAFFQPKQRSTTFIEVSGAIDLNNLPQGFFNVITASGKETLGFRGRTGTSFNCGTTIVDGAERHSLSIPRDQLPVVRLNFSSQQSDGVQQVRGHRLLDTSELDEFDGEFKYEPMR